MPDSSRPFLFRAVSVQDSDLLSSRVIELEIESDFCGGVDGDAGRCCSGCSELAAPYAQRWTPVSSTKLHYLSDLFFDPGDSCAAGW
jgi:hypothetical protein